MPRHLSGAVIHIRADGRCCVRLIVKQGWWGVKRSAECGMRILLFLNHQDTKYFIVLSHEGHEEHEEHEVLYCFGIEITGGAKSTESTEVFTVGFGLVYVW